MSNSEACITLIIIAFLIIFLIVGTILGERRERKAFNGGICPYCKFPLICFDMDSQGGRGYSCKRCDYTTWVSYKHIDKKTVQAEEGILNLPKMYDILRPHIGHDVVCVCYGKDGEDPVDICIECEDCGTVLISSEAYDMEV